MPCHPETAAGLPPIQTKCNLADIYVSGYGSGAPGGKTGLSWLCYFRALQLGEASRVAPVDKLGVVFVILLAAAFLGEKLSWHQWVGGALILAGAVIIAWKPA